MAITVHMTGPGRRRVLIEPYRHFARVVLDRDSYAYEARMAGRLEDAALRPGLGAAVDRLMEAAAVHLWAAGYTGGFTLTTGESYVSVCVPHRLAERAAEALVAAEFSGDFTGLDDLAAELAVPVDDWLAPGERELRQGVDFTAPVSTFLTFLREQARRRGLRLNGRAEPGRVWVRPTASDPDDPTLERPQPHVGPGEPGGVPERPRAERRERPRLQAVPVSFLDAVAREQECPCGSDDPYNEAGHVKAHVRWSTGVRIPKTVSWDGGAIAVVDATSPHAWRKLAYDCARVFQRAGGYTFPSFDVGDGRPDRADPGRRAYLYRAGGRVVGYAAVYDTQLAVWRSWDPGEAPDPPAANAGPRPVINAVFTADVWRRKGVAGDLVAAVAADAGCAVADLAWTPPFSPGGLALARTLSPGGVWLG